MIAKWFCLSFLLLATGCTTRQPAWVQLSPNQGEDVSLMLYSDAREVIKMMALPGDMVLLHVGHSRKDLAISQLLIFPITIADVLDLQDPFTTYLHAEYVESITKSGRLKTKGYYPIAKKFKGEQHRDYFSVYRIADSTLQQRPLEKEKSRSYPMIGWCGDYVAWAYDNEIYSWWNRLSPLNKVIAFLYPPEAVNTPDSIANSPDTVKILEVFQGEVIYPVAVNTKELIQHLEVYAGSSHPGLAEQASQCMAQIQARAGGAGSLQFEKIEK